MINELIQTEQKVLKDLQSRPSSECSCMSCVKMCEVCPCIGTPADIKKIIEAGHRSKLQVTYWAGGLRLGLPVIKMIAPRQLDNGHCAFLNKDNLCSLHASGLKPTEGKLTSSHESGTVAINATMPTVFLTAATWLFKSFDAEIKFCKFFLNDK